MPAGLGGSGWLALTLETAVGTYLPPTTAGTIWIPINSETLHYTEERYYASQIKQTTIVSDAKQGYYHIEGDVVLDVDVNNLPYWGYISRHAITKTGAGAPFTYDFVPSQAGSTSTAAAGAVPRTASITVVRNGVGFGYSGCIVNTWELTIDGGILRASLGILGMAEQVPAGLGTPAWVASSLFGADAHSLYVAAAGATPTFAAADVTFNGFTFNSNFNGAAQNRIVPNRGASYVSYGETEATYTTEADFLDRTEYDNYMNSVARAIRLESLKGGATFALATEAVQLTINRSVYDSYEPNLGGMGDLVMASVTGRVLGIAGGNPYKLTVKSGVSIT